MLFICKNSGRTVTTVLEEKRYNPRLNRSKSEFIQLMKTMNHAFADHMMGMFRFF